MMKPELIIFDHDGVLIDSEIIGHRHNAVEMSRLGFPMTVEKSIELLTGSTYDRFDKLMIQEYGKTMLESDIISINKKIEDSFPADLKPTPGITKVLDFLENKNIKKCIASNANYNYVVNTLTMVKLFDYFNQNGQIFNAPINKGKPAPEVFLLAAKHFNVDPKHCWAIEDSILGIEAAKAANMSVIGYLGASHAVVPSYRAKIQKANPDLIVNSADELLNALKEYF